MRLRGEGARTAKGEMGYTGVGGEEKLKKGGRDEGGEDKYLVFDNWGLKVRSPSRCYYYSSYTVCE